MTEPDWVSTDRSHRTATTTAALRHPLRFALSAITRRRGLSERFPVPTSTDEVLRRLVTMPVSTWTYGWEHPIVKHLGPMAQDFARSFGLGDSDRRIEGVDAAGVAMASIQALHRRLQALEVEVARLRAGGGVPS